ncbi:MAG TPA: hypothetical protein VHU81_00400 [Thermoanaerobaculia bacterium]|jgi:hypothetical protein|nr:hypothetical protein [Thermoanaerobaculia bacterium]
MMEEKDEKDRLPGRGPRQDREALAGLRVRAGLCETCEHLQVLASARSVFVRCGRADFDPRFPRYPGLPVMACPGYERAAI